MLVNASTIRPFNHIRSLSGRRAQASRVGDDADPSQIEPVRIPAGLDGDIVVGVADGVAAACLQQEVELAIGEKDVRSQQGGREARGTPTVLAVKPVVRAAGIVQEGKELDDLGNGSRAGGELQSIQAYARPVADAMDSVPVQLVAVPDYGDERRGDCGFLAWACHGGSLAGSRLME